MNCISSRCRLIYILEAGLLNTAPTNRISTMGVFIALEKIRPKNILLSKKYNAEIIIKASKLLHKIVMLSEDQRYSEAPTETLADFSN